MTFFLGTSGWSYPGRKERFFRPGRGNGDRPRPMLRSWEWPVMSRRRPPRRLTVPLRAINGDIYPTDVEGVREIKPDFEAVIMTHVGHYPMLERPEEFNRHAAAVVAELEKK